MQTKKIGICRFLLIEKTKLNYYSSSFNFSPPMAITSLFFLSCWNKIYLGFFNRSRKKHGRLKSMHCLQCFRIPLFIAAIKFSVGTVWNFLSLFPLLLLEIRDFLLFRRRVWATIPYPRCPRLSCGCNLFIFLFFCFFVTQSISFF